MDRLNAIDRPRSLNSTRSTSKHEDPHPLHIDFLDIPIAVSGVRPGIIELCGPSTSGKVHVHVLSISLEDT